MVLMLALPYDGDAESLVFVCDNKVCIYVFYSNSSKEVYN